MFVLARLVVDVLDLHDRIERMQTDLFEAEGSHVILHVQLHLALLPLKFSLELLAVFVLQRVDSSLVVILALLDVRLVGFLLFPRLLLEEHLQFVKLLRDVDQLPLEIVDGLAGLALDHVILLLQQIDARLAPRPDGLQLILVALTAVGMIALEMTLFIRQILNLKGCER